MSTATRRKPNPWSQMHYGLSGFDFVSILNLVLMGFGAYFIITKGRDFFSKVLSLPRGK